jgi:hypothetical protein
MGVGVYTLALVVEYLAVGTFAAADEYYKFV